MLRVISIVHLVEKEAYYHSICRKGYQNWEKSTNVAKVHSEKQNFNRRESEWHQNPKHHSPAFNIAN